MVRWLEQWLRRHFGPADVRRRCVRPAVDQLEDRRVPATFTVTTPLDRVDGGTLDNPLGANGKLSLREAINLANLTKGEDTVVLPAGTFKITRPGQGDDKNVSGDLDIAENLIIRGAGSGESIIHGNGLDRVLDAQAGVTSLVLRDLKVTGGLLPYNFLYNGGGLRVQGTADLTVAGCRFTKNQTGYNGGAIFTGGGSVVLIDTLFGKNLAPDDGGGVATAASDVQVTRCLFRFNEATDDQGGGLWVETNTSALNVSIVDSTFEENRSLDGDGGAVRVFSQSGTDSVGVTIRGSQFIGNVSGEDGGAVLLDLNAFTEGSLVNVTDCQFLGNIAEDDDGGGLALKIYGGQIEAVVSRCEFDRNVSGGSDSGGGVYAEFNGDGAGSEARFTVRDSVFTRNSGYDGGGMHVHFSYHETSTLQVSDTLLERNTAGDGEGGGICVTSKAYQNSPAINVNLDRVTMLGNTAMDGRGGGGLYVGHPEYSVTAVTIDASTFRNNSSSTNGGGVAIEGNGTNNTTLVMTRSTLANNRAALDGGGLWVASNNGTATSTVTNCTFSENRAGDQGGGLYSDNDSGTGSSTLNLLNTTVALNMAAMGGGVYSEAGSVFNFTNALVADNWASSAADGHDVNNGGTAGRMIDVSHNLIGKNDGAADSFAAGNPNGNGSRVGVAGDAIDPLLGELQDNGGPTATHALLAGSPAIDRGTDAGAPDHDQRGRSRPRDGDGRGEAVTDIGAFEA